MASGKLGYLRGASSPLLALFCSLCTPVHAWAVQQHGGAEGLVAHEIGHILFIAGMLFLLYRMRRPATSGYGWFEFKLFLVLIVLWNTLTFYGHWYHEILNPEKYVRLHGKITGFTLTGFVDALFYLSRLDHLVLLPAFLCLMLALIKWRKQG